MRKRGPIRTLHPCRKADDATLIGYARCSTDWQDLDAQRQVLLELGVAEDRIYTDHGLTGTTRRDLAELYSFSRPTGIRKLNRRLSP